MGAPKRPHERTVTKINLLVRMELANPQLSPVQVADLCGIKQGRMASLKMHPYYRRIYNQYTTGLISSLDLVVKENFNLNKSTLDAGVPIAIQALLNQALQTKDLRVQNKACNDILAMHGRFPKISKVAVIADTEAAAARDKDNKVANELIEVMKKAKAVPQPPSIDSPDITDTIQ